MSSDPQNPGGWPDAARPGMPMEPERDGWHWLQWVGLFPADTLGHTNPVARYWEKDGWWDGSMHRHARYWQQGWHYLGPCLTPAEIEARVAAARREGIEAAAEIAKQFAIHQGDAYDIVAAIRTKLLAEDGR